MLELEGIGKRYRSGDDVIRALDGVSLSVGAGELVALYGPSGSGKTTLLSIVAALIVPDRGEVRLGGRCVSNLTTRDAARYRLLQLGYVSQSLDLLPGVSAIDNAALKLFDTRIGVRAAHRRVAPLMERLGLTNRLQHRPDQLSAGERQRVLIARALATEPRLVLADEPTGSLDGDRSAEVLTLLTEICREQRVAMLLVTHDPRAADYARRAVELQDGRLLANEPQPAVRAVDELSR